MLQHECQGIYVTSWDKISRMSQFFYMEINILVFRPHPELQISENQKSISCLCLKLVNFKIGETANLKIEYNEKTGFKEKKPVFMYFLKKRKMHEKSKRKVQKSI